MKMNLKDAIDELRFINNNSEAGIYCVIARPSLQRYIYNEIKCNDAAFIDYKDFKAPGYDSSHVEIMSHFRHPSSIILVNSQDALRDKLYLGRLNFSREIIGQYLCINTILMLDKETYREINIHAKDVFDWIKIIIEVDDDVDADADVAETETSYEFLSLENKIDFAWAEICKGDYSKAKSILEDYVKDNNSLEAYAGLIYISYVLDDTELRERYLDKFIEEHWKAKDGDCSRRVN